MTVTLNPKSVAMAALGSACALGCAANHDASSRELVAVSHVASPPVGALSVSDDGSYEFVDSTKRTKHTGLLSDAELARLRSQISSPGLEALYGHRAASPDRCEHESTSYVVGSRLGSACFVPGDVSDPGARARLDFFVTLFTEKSATE
jgi:hypothetical protein